MRITQKPADVQHLKDVGHLEQTSASLGATRSILLLTIFYFSTFHSRHPEVSIKALLLLKGE
jgi:hypothetical protein